MKKWFACILIALMLLPALSSPASAAAQVDVFVTATPDTLPGAGNVTLNVTIRISAATVSQITDAALYMPGGAVPLQSWSLILANTPVNATIPNIYISEQQLGAPMPLEFHYVEAGVSKTIHTNVLISRGVPQVVHQTNARLTREASAEAAPPGSIVTFTYWVGNTGSLPIYNVHLEDAAVGFSGYREILSPNESATFYQSYTVTESVVSAPIMTYVGEDNKETSSVTLEPLTVLLADAKLSVSLEADNKQIRAGDPVWLTYSIVNEGNVPYYNIQISDDSGGMIPGSDVLQPGSSYVYTRLENLVKPAKFYFEVTCSDKLGNNSKFTSNVVEIEVVDVQQESLVPTRDLLDIKVDAKLKRLTTPGEVSFDITVRNLSDIDILELVISENSSGEFEKMDQLAPGDKMFNYKVNVTETTEFTFVVQGRIPSIGRVQAISETIQILFETEQEADTTPPWEGTPAPSDTEAEATPPSESLPSGSAGGSNNLLLMALVIVVVLIILCIIAIVTMTRRSRAAAYDYEDYHDDHDHHDNSDDSYYDPLANNSFHPPAGDSYDEPPIRTAKIPPAEPPIPETDDEVTMPVARRSVSTDDIPTRPREP